MNNRQRNLNDELSLSAGCVHSDSTAKSRLDDTPNRSLWNCTLLIVPQLAFDVIIRYRLCRNDPKFVYESHLGTFTDRAEPATPVVCPVKMDEKSCTERDAEKEDDERRTQRDSSDSGFLSRC